MNNNPELKVIESMEDIPEEVLMELSYGRGDDDEGEVG